MTASDLPNEKSPSERRKFQRIDFNTPVRISQGDLLWEAELKDISFKGALASKPDSWQDAELQKPFIIDVLLDEENHIQFVGTIKHEETDTLGFHCENMDLDSASTLRRLVELNLGDPALLERELAGLVSSD